MPRIYVHLSGRDVDKRLLEIHGLKGKEEEPLKITVRICPRCKVKNSPISKFCNKCGSLLNIKDALEIDKRVRIAEEVMEMLLKNHEVKLFLIEKLKELNLVDRLA